MHDDLPFCQPPGRKTVGDSPNLSKDEYHLSAKDGYHLSDVPENTKRVSFTSLTKTKKTPKRN